MIVGIVGIIALVVFGLIIRKFCWKKKINKVATIDEKMRVAREVS